MSDYKIPPEFFELLKESDVARVCGKIILTSSNDFNDALRARAFAYIEVSIDLSSKAWRLFYDENKIEREDEVHFTADPITKTIRRIT